jgi:TolB-like protein/DNA-binding winged helix-turn-helix (wHTH) protein/tetratricopeptide (TPR) repeat protein
MVEPGERELYRVGDLTLDVGARLLTRAGVVVPLPPKTFELFTELVRRAPGVVRRQELLDTVWAHELVNDEALTQRVMLLRRALGDDPKEPRFIASAPRWGYRLVAPVERVAVQTASTQALVERLPDDSRVSRLEAAIATTRRRGRWLVGTTVALAAAIIGGGLYLVIGQGHHSIDSLAIAPFAAVGSGSDTELLCSGIPTTLTATLGQVPNLRVIAASTMVRYTGKSIDPQKVGRQLGVRAVLTGTLGQRGPVIAIDTELVDVEDGTRLWGAHLERPVADIFAVQDEISREIAKGMRLRLTGEVRSRLARRTTESVEAYTLYLKGRYFWNKRNEKGFGDAIACFRAAIERDPSYALAYTGLADCFALEGSMEYGIAPPNDVMPKARAAATRALEIDPELAEAHASLGLVLWEYDWKRNDAERELRRAIELSPGYATAHQWLAEMLAEQGRAEEAWREIQRAQELDPLSLAIATDLGLLSYYQRDYERAAAYLRAALAMDPNFHQASLALGLVYLQQGEQAKAVEVFRTADEAVGGSPPTMAALGFACALAGRTSEARTLADGLLAGSRTHNVPSYYLAAIPLGLGDHERAFEWLDRACAERCSLLGTLKVDPAFDPIRGDPRFAALLRCVRLAD